MSNLKPDIVQPGVHPLVLALDRARQQSGLSWAELERRAGVGASVTHPWRTGAAAITLQNLEALFQVCGRGLRDVPLATAHSNIPRDFKVGGKYCTRTKGIFADITTHEGHLLYGNVIIMGTKFAQAWTLEGRIIPRGGEHPYDLLPLDTLP